MRFQRRFNLRRVRISHNALDFGGSTFVWGNSHSTKVALLDDKASAQKIEKEKLNEHMCSKLIHIFFLAILASHTNGLEKKELPMFQIKYLTFECAVTEGLCAVLKRSKYLHYPTTLQIKEKKIYV